MVQLTFIILHQWLQSLLMGWSSHTSLSLKQMVLSQRRSRPRRMRPTSGTSKSKKLLSGEAELACPPWALRTRPRGHVSSYRTSTGSSPTERTFETYRGRPPIRRRSNPSSPVATCPPMPLQGRPSRCTPPTRGSPRAGGPSASCRKSCRGVLLAGGARTPRLRALLGERVKELACSPSRLRRALSTCSLL